MLLLLLRGLTGPSSLTRVARACTWAGPCIAHVSPEVVRLLKRGFAYVGWDVKLNRGATAAPPSAAKVLEFLAKAVTKIEVTHRPLEGRCRPRALACSRHIVANFELRHPRLPVTNVGTTQTQPTDGSRHCHAGLRDPDGRQREADRGGA